MMKRNNLDRAKRSISNKDYSNALYNLHTQYTYFYKRKYQLSQLKMHQSFRTIANSKCEMYATWRKDFQKLDMEGFGLLRKIEANSEEKFESIDGEDLLKKTFTIRKHCKTFFDLREF